MFTKTVKYKDFLGMDREKTLYFHITRSRMIEMFMAEATFSGLDETVSTENIDDVDMKIVSNGLQERIRRTVRDGKGKDLLELWRWLLSNSYGEISDDGETFLQSEEIFEKWRQSASYEAMYSLLVEDSKIMKEFVNKVFPKDVETSTADPEFRSHREAIAKRSAE